jgi:hypothetical protein
VEKDAKKKSTKKKTCKVGGLWVDLKQYPLLEQLETQEESNGENKTEDGGESGKKETKIMKKNGRR